ncbi:hypothetical protein EAH_00060470 [Eimeria acervulina]|uniref:Uncharacterized protein n=1 Tax=Eimeria acervulina TaxID=5801 RepID=U6GP38_EIMAC|nr:hypothetical protein EAH_00060470 [Eimeria acervulina]CDI81342.1 hypothetical protein EAH_00060470 [Eimeria acervulina]
MQKIFTKFSSSVRTLKFGVVDLKKHKLNLHEVVPFSPSLNPGETSVLCFANITPREKVEELKLLRRREDVSRHTLSVSVYQGDFADFTSLESFATRCASAVKGRAIVEQGCSSSAAVEAAQQQQQQQQQHQRRRHWISSSNAAAGAALQQQEQHCNSRNSTGTAGTALQQQQQQHCSSCKST